MSLEVLANRYLSAYINCFEDRNKNAAYEDLNLYVKQIVDSNDLYDFLLNPSVNFEEKSKVVSNIIDSKKLIIKNFLFLLISKGRFELVGVLSPLIDKAILDLNNCLLASVYSPVELSKSDVDNITEFLNKKFDKEIKFDFIKDESILAGVRIEVNNKMFDATLNSSLQKLKLAYK